MMGSDPEREKERDDSETLHQVTITKPYWLQTTEVTEALFEDVMGYNPAPECRNCRNPDFPVRRVTPTQVDQFVRALNHRRQKQGDQCRYALPTEAQWEFAVRAGTSTRWFFGDDENLLSDYAQIRPSVVGDLQPNPWGLYDVYGNVEELVADNHSPHPKEPKIDPKQKQGKVALTKGGSYFDANIVWNGAYWADR